MHSRGTLDKLCLFCRTTCRWLSMFLPTKPGHSGGHCDDGQVSFTPTQDWELGAIVTLKHRGNSMAVMGWNETLERKHNIKCGSQATISQSCLHSPHSLSWPLGIHSTLQVAHISLVEAWRLQEASHKAAGEWVSVLSGIYEGSLSRLDGPEGNVAWENACPSPGAPLVMVAWLGYFDHFFLKPP